MRKVITKEVPRQVFDHEEISCDLCGFDEDDSYIFKVKVCVAEDSCAGTRITRDVCQTCYDGKLGRYMDAVFESLKAEDDNLNEEHEDRWYG